MKINEVSNPIKHFTATVRVVIGIGSVTARTSVTADTHQQARAILIRLYGVGNVISVSEVMHEAPETDQIQRQDVFSAPARRRHVPSTKRGPVQLSCVAETVIDEATQTLTPQQLQVKNLADKAKQITQQKKQLQARQAMTKAQEKMRDASKSLS